MTFYRKVNNKWKFETFLVQGKILGEPGESFAVFWLEPTKGQANFVGLNHAKCLHHELGGHGIRFDEELAENAKVFEMQFPSRLEVIGSG